MNITDITKEEFDALSVNEELSLETVYFITDTQDLYLGSECIGSLKERIESRAEEFSKLALKTAFDKVRDSIDSEYKTKYMYLMAEFDNYKKRAIIEKEDTIKLANKKIINSLISVIDDFERGIKFITDESREGVMLIYDKFIKLLEDNNVECINPQPGEEFNEEIHEAVAAIPASQDNEKCLIAECTEKGYTLNGKIIRYAKVVVMN